MAEPAGHRKAGEPGHGRAGIRLIAPLLVNKGAAALRLGFAAGFAAQTARLERSFSQLSPTIFAQRSAQIHAP